jgi:hypothetical protein
VLGYDSCLIIELRDARFLAANAKCSDLNEAQNGHNEAVVLLGQGGLRILRGLVSEGATSSPSAQVLLHIADPVLVRFALLANPSSAA